MKILRKEKNMRTLKLALVSTIALGLAAPAFAQNAAPTSTPAAPAVVAKSVTEKPATEAPKAVAKNETAVKTEAAPKTEATAKTDTTMKSENTAKVAPAAPTETTVGKTDQSSVKDTKTEPTKVHRKSHHKKSGTEEQKSAPDMTKS
jgi:hypothetical protein